MTPIQDVTEPQCNNCIHSIDWHRRPLSIAPEHKVICWSPGDDGTFKNRLTTVTNRAACRRHEFEDMPTLISRIDWKALTRQVRLPDWISTDSQKAGNQIIMKLVQTFRDKGYRVPDFPVIYATGARHG